MNLFFKVDLSLNSSPPDRFSYELRYLHQESIYKHPDVASFFIKNVSFCQKYIHGFSDGRKSSFYLPTCINGKYLLSRLSSFVPRHFVSAKSVSVNLYDHRKTFEQEWLG